MESRKTGKQYRKEYIELQKNMSSLDAHVTSRLVELGQRFPDAIIVKRYDDFVRAKCLTKNYVEDLDIDTRILYIEAIEDWNSKLENVKQLEI